MIHVNVCADSHVAHCGATVAEEYVDIVNRIHFSVFHEKVQIDITRSREMCSSEIDCEFVVDEYPDVVIAANAKFQPSLECKLCMGFKTEVLVAASIAFAVFFGGRPAVRI